MLALVLTEVQIDELLVTLLLDEVTPLLVVDTDVNDLLVDVELRLEDTAADEAGVVTLAEVDELFAVALLDDVAAEDDLLADDETAIDETGVDRLAEDDELFAVALLDDIAAEDDWLVDEETAADEAGVDALVEADELCPVVQLDDETAADDAGVDTLAEGDELFAVVLLDDGVAAEDLFVDDEAAADEAVAELLGEALDVARLALLLDDGALGLADVEDAREDESPPLDGFFVGQDFVVFGGQTIGDLDVDEDTGREMLTEPDTLDEDLADDGALEEAGLTEEPTLDALWEADMLDVEKLADPDAVLLAVLVAGDVVTPAEDDGTEDGTLDEAGLTEEPTPDDGVPDELIREDEDARPLDGFLDLLDLTGHADLDADRDAERETLTEADPLDGLADDGAVEDPGLTEEPTLDDGALEDAGLTEEPTAEELALDEAGTPLDGALDLVDLAEHTDVDFDREAEPEMLTELAALDVLTEDEALEDAGLTDEPTDTGALDVALAEAALDEGTADDALEEDTRDDERTPDEDFLVEQVLVVFEGQTEGDFDRDVNGRETVPLAETDCDEAVPDIGFDDETADMLEVVDSCTLDRHADAEALDTLADADDAGQPYLGEAYLPATSCATAATESPVK